MSGCREKATYAGRNRSDHQQANRRHGMRIFEWVLNVTASVAVWAAIAFLIFVAPFGRVVWG